MDFIDPKQRRSHIIRLFAGYFLVAILIIFASVVLLYQSYGYDLDRKTGLVIQNGLLFISSKPVSANIYLNGQLMKSSTDTRLTVPEKSYSIELLSDGYRPWFRTVDLTGGSIERITYPLLIPNKLTTTITQTVTTGSSFTTQSLDKHWLVLQKSSALYDLQIVDLNNAKPNSALLTLPTDIFTSTSEKESLTAVAWASDNKHFLLRHDYGSKYEYVMVDRETPTLSLNISKLVLLPGATMTLIDHKFDKLAVYDVVSHGLYSYDAKAKQLSLTLQNVLDYKTYGDQSVLYSTDNGQVGGKVYVRLWDGTVSNILQIFDAESVLKLDVAQLGGDYYFVVVNSKLLGRAYIYKNPQVAVKQGGYKSIVPVGVLRLDDIKYLSFSDGIRFIAAQNGSKFAIYDIENDRYYSYVSKLKLTEGQKAVWVDGFRLSIASGGSTSIFDFDGSNVQTLAPAYDNSSSNFVKDYSSYYSLSPSTTAPGQTVLTKTSLRLGLN